jgi:hypothetical protein
MIILLHHKVLADISGGDCYFWSSWSCACMIDETHIRGQFAMKLL